MIRAYAIIMVVLLHTAAPAMLNFSSISTSSWWVTNILFSFAHQGVPLFIFISGLLLLDPQKTESTTTFFRKRMSKVLWPFLFWSAFYYFWRLFYQDQSLTTSDAFALVVKGPMYYHLWFVYVIIGLYLATPILRSYTRNAPVANILYFVAVWAIFYSFFPLFSYFTGAHIGIRNVLFNSLVGYFLLGPLLKEFNVPRKYSWWIAITVVAATLFTAIGTHWLTLHSDGQYQDKFIRLYMPNINVISMGMFVLLLKCRHAGILKKQCIAVPIKHIAMYSFGIYLLHPAIIELLDAGWLGFSLHAMIIHPVVGIPLTVMATIAISFLVVAMLRQIPVLRNVVP